MTTPSPYSTVMEHLNSHLTDGRFHDDCTYCRQRRHLGGNGTEALCDAQDHAPFPVTAICTRLAGHTQPDHHDRLRGLFWTDPAPTENEHEGTP